MAVFDPYHKWLGIPPADQPPNHYRLLGLNLFETDPDVIDVATEQRVSYLRQCATGQHIAESQKLLNEVAAARLCLLNADKKRKYDENLRGSPLPSQTTAELASPTATPLVMPWEGPDEDAVEESGVPDFDAVALKSKTSRAIIRRQPLVMTPARIVAAIALLGMIAAGAVFSFGRRNPSEALEEPQPAATPTSQPKVVAKQTPTAKPTAPTNSVAPIPFLSEPAQIPSTIIASVPRVHAYAEPFNEKQTLDVYAAADGKSRPIVFWIHGGGWQVGNKSEVQLKPQAFLDRGLVFVSTNYRLLPNVTVRQIAGDVAKAIRWTHDHAAEFGGDSKKMFVMGHSAGAQMSALICTDDSYLRAEGLSLSDIKGCVPVDGDTYDVPLQIAAVEQRIAEIYVRKFGTIADQKALSPVSHVAAGKNIPPFLLLYVAGHPETKPQAERFAKVLNEAGRSVKAYPAENKTHASINNDLGRSGDEATEELFRFLDREIVAKSLTIEAAPSLKRIDIKETPSNLTTVKWDKVPTPAEGAKAPIELENGDILSSRTVPRRTGLAVICFRSRDAGKTWTEFSEIVADGDKTTDIGDGAFCQLHNGDVLFSYRHNKHSGRAPQQRSFSIKVVLSKDGGLTWQPHSTVISCNGTESGLWASFLLQKSDGTLQCYYDDEFTPSQNGNARHQWTQMKTWNTSEARWIKPVTVSRSNNKQHLSRDGMCSVVEVKPNHLVCVLESVRTEPPHKGVIRCVTSLDGGQTWSWLREERSIVYAPRDPTFNSLAPWMIKLQNGSLLCVFTTDEDCRVPDTPSTGRLNEDIKFVLSHDHGRTWSRIPGLIDNRRPNYLPGVLQLAANRFKGLVLATYVRTNRGCFAKQGIMATNDLSPFAPQLAPPNEWIDLLEKVDPAKDGLRGKWHHQNGSLFSDQTENALLRLPYRVPEEYDFKIEFEAETQAVTQILSTQGRHFAWLIGHWNNSRSGFELVNGQRALDNVTSSPHVLRPNTRQISVVEVRRDGVSAFLDGMLVSHHPSNGTDLSLHQSWGLSDDRALGLHCWNSRNRFLKIQVREVSGRGVLLR